MTRAGVHMPSLFHTSRHLIELPEPRLESNNLGDVLYVLLSKSVRHLALVAR